MYKKLLGLILLLAVAGHGQAALLDNGGFTTDTASGLDWLDLTATQSLSYNELVVVTGAGGLFEDYRLATLDEVGDLFSAAGLPPFGSDTNDFATVNSLIALIGSTRSQGSFLETIGITATPGTTSGRRVAALDFLTISGDPFYRISDALTYGETFGPDTVGGWLVRPTVVPLPPALLLFGSAMLLLLRRPLLQSCRDLRRAA